MQDGIGLGGFYFHPTNGEPTPTDSASFSPVDRVRTYAATIAAAKPDAAPMPSAQRGPKRFATQPTMGAPIGRRVRTFRDMADDFFDGYKLRLPDSAVFANYAIDHLKRLLGGKMLVDFSEAVVIKYQKDRLDEGAAPKTIKVRKTIGKAYSEREKERMLEAATSAWK
jgi:hypothetical protein